MPKSLTAACLALALALAACGSDTAETSTAADERSAPIEAEDVTTTTDAPEDEPEAPQSTEGATTTTEAADEAMTEDESATDVDVDDAMEDETLFVDEDGEEVVADDLAQEILRQMMVAMGIEDVDAAMACVDERYASEGFTEAEDSDGGAQMVALAGCQPTLLADLYGLRGAGELEFAGFEEGQVSCALGSLTESISTIPLVDADTVMGADLPPDEMLDKAASDCDVDREAFVELPNN